jgi:poly(3-hydroxybutyrate) depolymerase
MLFNTTTVPDAQYREWPATVINGSSEVNEKYAALNTEEHRLFIGSSSTTDGFDTSILGERYDQLTSVRRVQLMAGGVDDPVNNPSNIFIADITDFGSLGVTTDQVDLTLAPSREAMYLSYIPEGVDQSDAGSVPLVMLFHGSGERAEWIAMHTEWPTVAAEEGFIVVAVDDHLGQRTPGNLTTAQVTELMDDVFERYPAIDRTRVYATGFSAGSMRTISMGTQRPDLFAAIAPINGYTTLANTNDALMLPTMLIGGQADGLIPNFPSHRAGGVYTGAPNSADRVVDQLFTMNDIRGGSYTYDTAGSSTWWGLTPDEVEVVPSPNGISVFTMNSLRSPDGITYTKLVDVSAKNHFTYPDEAPLIWEFFEQFGRNADGSISLTPSFDVVNDYVDQAERDGVLTGPALSQVRKHVAQAEKLADTGAAASAVAAQLETAARKSGLPADSNVVASLGSLADAS